MIDFDHNATTPLDRRVREAMIELLGDPRLDGNPSSVHGRGRRARAVVEDARRQVARAVHAEPLGVTFTSGGTEADALAIVGTCRARRRAGQPCGLLTSVIEHPAVLGAGQTLAAEGVARVDVELDGQGRVDVEAVEAALREHPEVGVISIATANHELGNVNDIPALVDRVRAVASARGETVVVHTDAVQAFGKVPVDFTGWDVDLMSVSSHKIYGPKGVGALIHRPHHVLAPLWIGGSQERGRRVGTEAVPAIHGFGVAAGLVADELADRRAHIVALRQRLRDGLAKVAPDALVQGDPERHLGNTLLVEFPGCRGELMLMNLDLEDVAVSTGSACNSGKFAASKVLLALGRPPERASCALRFSLGKGNTEAEVDRVLSLLPAILDRVRAVESGEGAD